MSREVEGVKTISPLFASALFDEKREIADAFVWRLVYGDAVLRTISVPYERGPLSFDVGDGDGSQTFEPFPVRRTVLKCGGDLTVDEGQLILPNVEILISFSGGSERSYLGDMVLNGVMDNAEVWIYQVNLKNLATMTHSRWDIVGASEVNELEVTLELKSPMGRCVRPSPHTIIQAGCNNNLYDSFCGLNKADYIVSSSVITGSRTTLTSALAQADYYFDLGQIEFTSGRNAGAFRTVGKHLNLDGRLTWNVPLRFSVEPGDRFTVVPGCSKSWSVCNTKFSNTAKFRGFPNIPTAETY